MDLSIEDDDVRKEMEIESLTLDNRKKEIQFCHLAPSIYLCILIDSSHEWEKCHLGPWDSWLNTKTNYVSFSICKKKIFFHRF